MSIPCYCVNCGGNEPEFTCENAHLDAWAEAYGQKKIFNWNIIFKVLIGAILILLCIEFFTNSFGN